MPSRMGDVRADQNVAMGSDVSDARLNSLIVAQVPDAQVGQSGYSGAQGSSGISGVSGFGTSGTSGVQGVSGVSGASGLSGVSGIGTSGVSGRSGFSGTGGISGTSGTQGASGTSGFSGIQGVSGVSGVSGAQGSTGTSGASGASGTSGFAGLSYDASCQSYRDRLTTTGITPTVVRTLTMATNSLMFVDVIATFQDTATHLTGGYIWATLSFARALGAPISLGTLDILESHNLNGPSVTIIPNLVSNNVDVMVSGKAATSISWSIRTTADRGNP